MLFKLFGNQHHWARMYVTASHEVKFSQGSMITEWGSHFDIKFHIKYQILDQILHFDMKYLIFDIKFDISSIKIWFLIYQKGSNFDGSKFDGSNIKIWYLMYQFWIKYYLISNSEFWWIKFLASGVDRFSGRIYQITNAFWSVLRFEQWFSLISLFSSWFLIWIWYVELWHDPIGSNYQCFLIGFSVFQPSVRKYLIRIMLFPQGIWSFATFPDQIFYRNISFHLVFWYFKAISWNPGWALAEQRICTICDFTFDGSIVFDIKIWCWWINFGSISNLIVDISILDQIWYWSELISNFRLDHQLDDQIRSSNIIFWYQFRSNLIIKFDIWWIKIFDPSKFDPRFDLIHQFW